MSENSFKNAKDNIELINSNIKKITPITSTEIKKYIDEFNPLEQEFKSSSGYKAKWKISPDIDDIEHTKFMLEFGKEFKDQNVNITITVNGEIANFTSGINKSDFNCQFKATKRF